MSKAGVIGTQYRQVDNLIAGNVVEKEILIKSGVGVCERGQVMAYNTNTGEWVKYVSGGANETGTVRAVITEREGVDATLEDVTAKAVVSGDLSIQGIKGVNLLITGIDTPEAPTLEAQAGGSLAATTEYAYKVAALSEFGGITAVGTQSTLTTLADAAGYFQSGAYADIAAINAVLGDCSTTPKTLTFNVDGLQFAVIFNADYTGAGAFADHAALITKLEGANTEYTATSSDGAPIKITSATTGSTSVATVVVDGSGLFGTLVTVAGTDESETIKVTVDEIVNANGYRVWRSADGGATWAYRDMTAVEVQLGYFIDDGTLTFTAGTPVSANDYSAIADMWDRGIYIKEMNIMFDFRGGF